MSNTVTVLVGNGLGMALDSKYFTLEAGMKSAWDKMKEEGGVDSTTFQKALKAFLDEKVPENEDDLQKFHETLITLLKIESLGKQIPEEIMKVIHPEAHNFKTSYREYILHVAAHFYNYDVKIYNDPFVFGSIEILNGIPQASRSPFEKFIEKFTNFIKGKFESGGIVHVATLNYDGLLYREFINSKIISRTGGSLFDGVSTKVGLNRKVLDWTGKGRYLHLHGSPMFYNDSDRFYSNSDSSIRKDSEENGRNAFKPFVIDDKFRPHIVLCHSTQKEPYINRSELLRTYFEYFEKSLIQSDLLIIGYSGKDLHVNKAIRDLRKKSSEPLIVKVVEYKDPNYQEGQRQLFWEERLGADVNYEALSSILDYDFSI